MSGGRVSICPGVCLLGRCLPRGGVCPAVCPGGGCPGGVCPWGGLPRGVSTQCLLGDVCQTPPVNRITDRCKNITLPQRRCGRLEKVTSCSVVKLNCAALTFTIYPRTCYGFHLHCVEIRFLGRKLSVIKYRDIYFMHCVKNWVLRSLTLSSCRMLFADKELRKTC